MGNKGSNTTTSQSYANPQAMAAYSDLLARAAGVASQPYQAYGGEQVAPINAQQQAGFGNINSLAGQAGSNITQASGLLQNYAQPVNASDVAQWYNPYEHDVVDATQAQFDHDNAVQQSQVTGNAAAQNALGGDRSAVAAALTAEGQQRAQAPVIAGLRQQGYQSAVQNALAARGQGMQAAGQLAGVANQGLPTAQAQVGAGSLEQQTQQARDTAAFQDYLRQQGYPFQTAQWLAGIQTGVGSNMGGYSTTQGPTPNPWSQIAGLGMAAASFLGANRGGRIERAGGGYVGPYAGAESYVPTAQIHQGHGPPQAPQAQKQAGLGMKDWGQLGAAANKWWNDEDTTPDYSMKIGDYSMPVFDGRTTEAASGGRVGYAGGGAPSLTNGSLPWLDDQMEADKWYAPTTAGFGASRPAADLDFEDRWVDVPKDYTREGAIKRNLLQGAGTVSDSPAVQDRLQAGLLEPPERLPEEREASVPMPRSRPGLQDDGLSAIDTAMGAPEGEPSEAMGYAGQPAPRPGVGAPPPPTPPQAAAPAAGEPSGIGGILQRLGFKMSPELRQGLLQAGLGMMAGGHGGPGSFLQNLGEGGMYGVQGYNQSLIQQRRDRLEQEQLARQKRQEDFEREKFERPYREMTQAQKDAASRARENRIPFGWTEDKNGNPIMIPGGPADPDYLKKVNAAKREPINDDDAKALARYYVQTGDASRVNGLGLTSEARQRFQHFVRQQQDELGVSDQDLATKVAEFAGRKAGQRTLSTQEAKMGSAAFEAEGAIQLARDIVSRVPRTSILPLNRLIEGYQKQTLSPDQAELYTRMQGIINTYAAVMARGANVTTDSARHRAEDLLNTAANADVLNRVMDTMQSEIDMAKKSPERMREFYRKQFGEKSVTPETAAATPAKQLSREDQQALDWANAHPDDKRAAAIKKKLGVQ